MSDEPLYCRTPMRATEEKMVNTGDYEGQTHTEADWATEGEPRCSRMHHSSGRRCRLPLGHTSVWHDDGCMFGPLWKNGDDDDGGTEDERKDVNDGR